MILKEISELLLTGKMNDNKIHIKVESLVKSAEKTFEDYDSQTPRAIVWLRYSISAIFAGVFKKFLIRLQALFNDKFIYVSGMTW